MDTFDKLTMEQAQQEMEIGLYGRASAYTGFLKTDGRTGLGKTAGRLQALLSFLESRKAVRGVCICQSIYLEDSENKGRTYGFKYLPGDCQIFGD